MDYNELVSLIRAKRSFLCIGLDSDPSKLPPHLNSYDDPVFEFNKQIVDATIDLAMAYKPNLAFYESSGIKGWESLAKTIKYIRSLKQNIFLIADAKCGDIGNTSKHYAKAFFEEMDFDAVTVAPYMGEDSISPFLSYPGKWVILLALTSNKGAEDFQFFEDKYGTKLYQRVLQRSLKWGSKNNLMYVAGATRADVLADIRTIIPDHFLLVPGIGAQGGSLEEAAKYGMNENCGMIVNSSRGIIFASDGQDFAEKARENALEVQEQMDKILIFK